MMAARLPIAAIWALLVLALLLSPLLGLLTPYVSLLIVVPVFAATLARGQLRQAYATFEARAFLAVFLVLAVICAVTADSASDVLRALNFTMLLAYGPLVLLMRRHAGRVGVERVAQLAALGVAIGLAEVALSVAVPDIRYLHYDRPTGPDIGPIVLSNGLLALGFIASGAVLLGRDGRSWPYLLAPLAAIIATLITGSRGPLIGVPVAVLVAALFVWRIRFGGSRRAGWVGLGGLALVGIAGAAVVLRGRAGSIIDIAGSLFGGGTVVDESTRQRLALYDAGSKSFVESPWIGHGWGNIMESVRPLLSTSNASLADLPQLHNDVLNFAVGAGIVGVLCYLAIITAPIVGALRSPRDALRPFRLYGTAMLTIVYVGGGLTDLMFGFEYHTYLFAMLTAILIGLCREPEGAT
jgi:O-antigen ligase